MSMISEQVKNIRKVAKSHRPYVPSVITEALTEAADTMEALSTKLVANMERSLMCYGDGWIACEDRLPEENQRVLASFSHGAVTILTYYDKKFHGIYDYTINTVLAWQPLPEPYNINIKNNNN